MGLEFSDPYAPLPAGLPVPVDDGACRHLVGMRLPAVTLQSSSNDAVDLSQIAFRDRMVLFFFPAAGRPGVPDPIGWSLMPGARGCTPQLCDYRDATSEFQKLGIGLFGVSSQRHEDQVEIAYRNRLRYELLSDEELRLTKALRLPTFKVESPVGLVPPVCIKRLTLVVGKGRIEKVFYPVFPPDKNAGEVLAYLNESRPV
ncbi:MAG TPA: peroxiredoxin [Candidatus Angelobacter sp.]|nr:peroxiredoxin [Candidatus Angelobacter sp.]